jgi:hypothetical protein
MSPYRILCSAAFLLILTGCAGTNSSTQPTAPVQLAYTDPTGTGWRLVKDASSTPTNLVLALVGPAATLSRGVGLSVVMDDPHVQYARFADDSYIQDTGVYDLYQQTAPVQWYEPTLIAGGVKGPKLMLGIFQKEPTKSAKPSDSPLLRFTVKVNPSIIDYYPVQVPISVVKAKILPENIASSTTALETITVSVGKLAVN